MKETVNFGFKKPESTDFVDVGVFGENFDKIDEALTPYRINTGKDHDFSFAAGEEDNISVLNLTELLGASAAEIIAAFDIGRPVVVSVADSANEFADVSVVLTQKSVYGTITSLSGMAPNPLTEHYNTVIRFSLVLTLGDDGSYTVKLQIMDHAASGSGSGSGGGLTPEQAAQIQANTDAIAAIPVKVSDDGYTEISGQRQATDIQFNRTEQNIEINITMEGNVAYNGNIELDDDGFPVKYTENGREVTLEFTGFDDLLTTLWEGGSY